MTAGEAAAAGDAIEAALALHQDGDLAAAERRYLHILEAQPTHFSALLNLGVLRLQQARSDEALWLTQQALAQDPHSAEAQANLGAALSGLGRNAEAVDAYDAALALDADRAESHFGLATALAALARYDEALACYDRALSIDEDYAEAHCGRGAVLNALHRHEAAAADFRAALAIDPDYPEANHGYAVALQALRQDHEALRHYQRALEAKPDFIEAIAAAGEALRRMDRHDDALAHFQRLVALQPGQAHPYVNLGNVLEEQGRLAEARGCFEQALAIDPASIPAYYALFQSARAVAGEPLLLALTALAEASSSLPEHQQTLLHFALGKALTDAGEPARGFEHLLRGNALKRQAIDYDEHATLEFFRRTIEVFTPELMASVGEVGDPGATPIFIVGMPRSGSTLVEQILASHPAVSGGGERPAWKDAMVDLGLQTPGRSFPEAVRGMPPQAFRHLSERYLTRLRAVAPDAPHITDKTLANLCSVGLIHLALPKARIIHTCRDPIDTCLSCFGLLFSDDQPFAFDLGELGRYYSACRELAAHWRAILPPQVMLDLQYEDLVGDFEHEARRLIAHCGLPWDDACLAFHKTARPVRTASVAQVREPIFRSSIGRWRPDDDVLRPLLQGLSGGP